MLGCFVWGGGGGGIQQVDEALHQSGYSVGGIRKFTNQGTP